MEHINGKVAFVTGASRGIGREIAIYLGREKVKVCLIATNETYLREVKQTIESSGGKAIYCVCDVRNRSAMEEAAKRAEKELGPIDILINNAGIMPVSWIKSLKQDEWDKTIDVNCKGVMNGIGVCLDSMIKRKTGHIIFISSDAGKKPFPGISVYSATKYFVEGIARGLRQEVKEYNIKVTTIQPGDVSTDLGMDTTDKDAFDKLYANVAGKPMLETTQIAESVLYALKQPLVCCVNEILIQPIDQPL